MPLFIKKWTVLKIDQYHTFSLFHFSRQRKLGWWYRLSYPRYVYMCIAACEYVKLSQYILFPTKVTYKIIIIAFF